MTVLDLQRACARLGEVEDEREVREYLEVYTP